MIIFNSNKHFIHKHLYMSDFLLVRDIFYKNTIFKSWLYKTFKTETRK